MARLLGAAAAVSAAAPKTVVTILIDDLGFYDTAVNNPDIGWVTPTLQTLSHEQGLRLDRFYTYKYCSPTRRGFLAGRFPVHMSPMQAQPCDNTLPMQLTILPQKLKQAVVPWATHMVGKGHLGYPTTDHLPINRGFDTHAGYLAGAEDYDHGFNYDPTHDCGGTPKDCVYDFWHNEAPGSDVHNEIFYSTNWYTERAQQIVTQHHSNSSTKSTPLWLHLTYQGVHSPYVDPPSWEGIPANSGFWDKTFGDMLRVVDTGIGNLTATLRGIGAWDECLMIVTSDNGGIGPGNNFPLRGHKATPWEGGTRVMGFITGGFLPANLRGRTFPRVIGVQDWYPTLCGFAGVDPSDNVTIDGTMHPIDGVDVWPTVLAFSSANPPPILHEWLPTTEESLIWSERWKLITNAQSTTWYTPNCTHVEDNKTAFPCRGGGPPPSPPAPPVPCDASIAGYTCHSTSYCGPQKSFYSTAKTKTAEECATLCSANSTGCHCFDFRSGNNDEACRLHHNGSDLEFSHAGYSAYVKQELHHWRSKNDIISEFRLATGDRSSCNVCTPAQPCLFDLFTDPEERVNVAAQNPDIVKTMQFRMSHFYAPYIGKKMTAKELEPYECVKDIRPWWGNFSGPCCRPKV